MGGKELDKYNETNLNLTTEAGFKALVQQHAPVLYAHIRSIVLNHDDTDDVLQNTFIKAWQNLASFRSESGIGTWLFRIATNEALQHIRRNRFRRFFTTTDQINQDDFVQQGVMPDGENIKMKLEKAMHTLSVQQRMVFGMKYFNELKYTEIAEATGLAEGTLKAVYHNAVKKIEKYITHKASDHD
jgi:RNA polymerase sigma factor (sigma-70 family)